jgi:non-specific serine/threonine protein kinase
MTGPRQGRWAVRVEREHQNLRAAFERSLASPGAPEVATKIALGLWRFWRTGSHIGDGRQWLARLVPAVAGQPAQVRAEVLHAAAVLAGAQDDHETGYALAQESLRCARAAGDPHTTAQACNALGIAATAAGDYDAARGFFADSLVICEEQSDPLGMAIAHGNLTRLALRTGDVEAASRHAQRCLELVEGAPEAEDWDLPFAYEALARAHAQGGDPEDAARYRRLAQETGEAITDAEDRDLLLAALATLP